MHSTLSIYDIGISSQSEIYLEHLSISFPSLLIKYKENNMTMRSRDSAVGLATGYELDDGEVEVRVPVDAKMFYPRLSDRY
jgi:hypothetical protein